MRDTTDEDPGGYQRDCQQDRSHEDSRHAFLIAGCRDELERSRPTARDTERFADLLASFRP
jgi:hypothetical protein